MKRSIVVLALVAALVWSAGCGREETGGAGLVRVGKHTWALIASGSTSAEGLGANCGFVVGKKGVAVIDSRLTPAMANDLVERIREVTELPILWVVNTHYHQDHTWGNSVFKDLGATVIATAETRDAFERYSPIYLDIYRGRGPKDFAPFADLRLVSPDTVFAGEAKLDLGGVAVELQSFGPGHTAGDVVVFVPKDRVVFAGGLLSNGYHPNLGDPGVDFDNWLETLGRMEQMNARLYVPGQGGACDKDAIAAEKRYIETLRNICIDAIRKRYPLEEVIRTLRVPGTDGWLQPNIIPFNVQAIYRREIPTIVNPGFALDLPPEFLILDGGGNPKTGYIRWGAQSGEGYLEIEVQWKISAQTELIPQDIAEAVSRYDEQGGRLMKIERTARAELPSGPAIAASGTWRGKDVTTDPGGGLWKWTMMLRDGKLYVVQCTTEAAFDRAKEQRNIEELERIASTFRVKE